MATRAAPSSLSWPGVAARPSIRAALLLPSWRCSATASKTASTLAVSAPWRTWSAPPRAPRVRLSASMISDLPLPVSPVSRFSPAPKRTVDSATRARSRTLSVFSMKRPLLLRDQRPAPTELLPKPPVESLRRAEPHDFQLARIGAASDHVARRDGTAATAAVYAHLGRPLDDFQSDEI